MQGYFFSCFLRKQFINNMNLDQHFWEERYANQQTEWDLGEISPPLKAYFDTLTNKHIAILIPGCGNAHEAAYLLSLEFTNITLIDIAISAVNSITNKLHSHIKSGALKVIHGDFFDYQGQFDLILEQTFFCAINPPLRVDYAKKMHDLLSLNGVLAGVLFNREFEGGPPFGGNIHEYKTIFTPYFSKISIVPCEHSAKPRAGNEVFIELFK